MQFFIVCYVIIPPNKTVHKAKYATHRNPIQSSHKQIPVSSSAMFLADDDIVDVPWSSSLSVSKRCNLLASEVQGYSRHGRSLRIGGRAGWIRRGGGVTDQLAKPARTTLCRGNVALS